MSRNKTVLTAREKRKAINRFQVQMLLNQIVDVGEVVQQIFGNKTRGGVHYRLLAAIADAEGFPQVSINRHKSVDGNKTPSEFISRHAAAIALRVTPATIEKLVGILNLETWKVPGHSRLWINRAAIEKLAIAARVTHLPKRNQS